MKLLHGSNVGEVEEDVHDVDARQLHGGEEPGEWLPGQEGVEVGETGVNRPSLDLAAELGGGDEAACGGEGWSGGGGGGGRRRGAGRRHGDDWKSFGDLQELVVGWRA